MIRPYPPLTIKNAIAYRAETYNYPDIQDWAKGTTLGALDAACGDKEGRYKVLSFLFDNFKSTSKDLSNEQLSALKDWVAPFKNKYKKWDAQEWLEAECKIILQVVDWGIEDPYAHGKQVLDIDVEWVHRKLNAGIFEKEHDAISAWFLMTLGKGSYHMHCGHKNDSYDVAGNPVCNNCGPEIPVSRMVMWKVEE